jgi:hypothetical protein
MQTTLHKPYFSNTEWVHVEKKITKYFRFDDNSKMVYVYNSMNKTYTPICSEKNKACSVKWSDNVISVDATAAPDDPMPPYIDFRRSFTLTNGTKGHFVIADYGDSKDGKANMYWTFDGDCQNYSGEIPELNLGGNSPTYVDLLVMPVSKEEARKVLAPRVGNTMTGSSAGGKSWLHMWVFNEDGLHYKGDGDDITGERTPSILYVGKDTDGKYRVCLEPIPADGTHGCYPFPTVKLGDKWIEQDVKGEANFTLLPGRQ